MAYCSAKLRQSAPFATAVVILLAAQAALFGAGQQERVIVDDPRPMAAAAEKIERMCRCVVTYEDPRWTREQVADVTARVRQDGKSYPRVYGPAGKAFAFSFVLPSEGANSTAFMEALGVVVDDFHRSGNPGAFAISGEGSIHHVRPAGGSLLDSRISLSPTTSNALALVEALLKSVGAAQGVMAIMGVAPDAFLARVPVQERATNERAEAMLTRILVSTQQQLSWRLFYDFGTQKYVLNIHIVR